MIFGRSSNLVLGLLVATWNVVAIALPSINGQSFTTEFNAAVNIMLGALVAVVATTGGTKVK